MKRETQKRLNKSGQHFCDLCKNQEFLVEHHIRGRKIPNPNRKSNLCNVCSNCHYKIHKGAIIIEDWISTTEGRKLYWHLNDQESFSGQNAEVHLF